MRDEKWKALAAVAFCVLHSVPCSAMPARWGSDGGIRARRDRAVPGVLVATEVFDGGSNRVAALSAGTPDRSFVRVVDRHALHRTPLEPLEYPGFYVEVGADTSLVSPTTIRVFDGFVVAGTGTNPEQTTHTRTFRVMPLDGFHVAQAEIAKGAVSVAGYGGSRPETLVALDWDCQDDGSVLVSATVRSAMDTYAYTADVEVGALLGFPAGDRDVVEDLTLADCRFRDTWGETSLGGLRGWVMERYDAERARHWAGFPAEGAANLAGNDLKFTRGTYVKTTSTSSPDDTLTVWQNGNVVLRASSHAATNGTFRILGISPGTDCDYIYTDTSVADPPWALVCADLAAGQWERPDGQTTTNATYFGGAAWRISVPKSPGTGSRFFKAVSTAGESAAWLYTDAVVFAPAGIALRDDSGGWWKLGVSTNGVVSAAQILDVPEGLPQ